MYIAREIFLDMVTIGMDEERARAVREYFTRIFEMIPEPEDDETESEEYTTEDEDCENWNDSLGTVFFVIYLHLIEGGTSRYS